jgi:hypothetical protein
VAEYEPRRTGVDSMAGGGSLVGTQRGQSSVDVSETTTTTIPMDERLAVRPNGKSSWPVQEVPVVVDDEEEEKAKRAVLLGRDLVDGLRPDWVGTVKTPRKHYQRRRRRRRS